MAADSKHVAETHAGESKADGKDAVYLESRWMFTECDSIIVQLLLGVCDWAIVINIFFSEIESS